MEKVTEVINGNVTITEEEYNNLLKDSDFLNCLLGAGVDNWNGYEYACEMMQELD